MRETYRSKGRSGDGCMEDGDDELIVRVARGDGAAFARLVGRYRTKMIAMTTRIVGNRAVAEEIVQEAFTRAWINAPRWRPLHPNSIPIPRAGFSRAIENGVAA